MYSQRVTGHHKPGTHLWDLTQVVNRAWVLNELLEGETHQPVGRGYGSSGGGSKPGSRPPWASQAATLVTNLHAVARDLETEFLRLVNPNSTTRRGGSTRNTWLALYHLTELGVAAPDSTVRRGTHTLTKWTWQTEVFLGQREPIHRLPREMGHTEPSCPWCTFRTLRYRISDGVIFCVNPTCRDHDGERVTATLTVRLNGDLTLTWQNGAEHVPVPGSTRGDVVQ